MSTRSLTAWMAAAGDVGRPETLLVRIMLGGVFMSEGIQKFLFSAELGVGRFVKIGIPAPEIFGPFVGGVEIIFGALILIGLFSRLSAIPLLIDMLVAICTTKIPILLQSGFWKMVHEARVDISMVLGLLYILAAGSGRWSLDRGRVARTDNASK